MRIEGGGSICTFCATMKGGTVCISVCDICVGRWNKTISPYCVTDEMHVNFWLQLKGPGYEAKASCLQRHGATCYI